MSTRTMQRASSIITAWYRILFSSLIRSFDDDTVLNLSSRVFHIWLCLLCRSPISPALFPLSAPILIPLQLQLRPCLLHGMVFLTPPMYAHSRVPSSSLPGRRLLGTNTVLYNPVNKRLTTTTTTLKGGLLRQHMSFWHQRMVIPRWRRRNRGKKWIANRIFSMR